MANAMERTFPKTAENLAYEAKGGVLVPISCGCGAWIGWEPREWHSGVSMTTCATCTAFLERHGTLSRRAIVAVPRN